MDLLKTKENIEKKKSEREQIKGRLSEVQSQLKDKFKVKSLGEAKALLQQKTEESEKLSADYDKKVDEFKEKFGELVEG
jgi:hypothetical protein